MSKLRKCFNLGIVFLATTIFHTAEGAKTGPEGFWWGISTSSYQTEEQPPDPKGLGYFETDWDVFYKHGKLKEPRANGVYSYSEVERDILALKSLGVTHYRFGIEWARIEPKPGQYNEEALKHYISVIDRLRASGIEPIVCLWHFTFPSWLSDLAKPDQNGWLHPMAKEHWINYVRYVTNAIQDKVLYYAPQNEPNAQSLAAYVVGSFPPGVRFNFELYRKHMGAAAEAYIDAARTIRSEDKQAHIITIQNIIHWERAWWDLIGYFYKMGEEYNYQHLDLVAEHSDWIGLNYYYKLKASPFDNPRIDYPEGLEKALGDLAERYKKPVIVMENGVADAGDERRQNYLRTHVETVQRAANKGIDVRGYFYWSLVDNYEWAHGYSERFGLFSLQPDRSLKEKESAGLYRTLIQKSLVTR